MNTKRTFAGVPDAIAKMAAEAPGGSAAMPAPETMPATRTAEPQAASDLLARPMFREREATQKMTVNMPKGLYEELRAYMKLTDTPMSDVLVEGARRELARLRKDGRG
jgi:hypothetical protein